MGYCLLHITVTATLETLRVYTEITDRRKRAAYERLGVYLKEVANR